MVGLAAGPDGALVCGARCCHFGFRRLFGVEKSESGRSARTTDDEADEMVVAMDIYGESFLWWSLLSCQCRSSRRRGEDRRTCTLVVLNSGTG